MKTAWIHFFLRHTCRSSDSVCSQICILAKEQKSSVLLASEPRLSSSFSSLAVRTASDEKLDESLGSEASILLLLHVSKCIQLLLTWLKE